MCFSRHYWAPLCVHIGVSLLIGHGWFWAVGSKRWLWTRWSAISKRWVVCILLHGGCSSLIYRWGWPRCFITAWLLLVLVLVLRLSLRIGVLFDLTLVLSYIPPTTTDGLIINCGLKCPCELCRLISLLLNRFYSSQSWLLRIKVLFSCRSLLHGILEWRIVIFYYWILGVEIEGPVKNLLTAFCRITSHVIILWLMPCIRWCNRQRSWDVIHILFNLLVIWGFIVAVAPINHVL